MDRANLRFEGQVEMCFWRASVERAGGEREAGRREVGASGPFGLADVRLLFCTFFSNVSESRSRARGIGQEGGRERAHLHPLTSVFSNVSRNERGQ